MRRPFADIVTARIRLRGQPADAEDAALGTTVAELRRIAAAHETYAALLPDRENRASRASPIVPLLLRNSLAPA